MSAPDLLPRAHAAIGAGVAFLERTQLPDGELPTMRWRRGDPEAPWRDRTVFGTALVAVSIAGVRGVERVVARAADSIESQTLRFGIWKYSPDYGGGFPPDLDDTAMASLALRLAGREVPDNTHAFLANRNRDGLFFTWLSPRLRWLRDPRMWLIAAARWRHPFVHYRAFRVAGAREHDLDAVVNANVLYYLGRTAATEPIVPFLLRVLRERAEVGCDKWYDHRLGIWYFLSRALRHAGAGARPLLLERLRSEPVETPLEHAFAACVLLDCDAPADAHIASIVETQLDSGGWPRAMVYGDEWDGRGSESLTTAFCLEALSRWIARTPPQE
ncbi:MAG TPA: hypothetical protein VEO54_24195 [Thermoanaerobaculia bacterium]|nr:hypothetical protein [Thermoanaerobaculia bacterium]